MDKIGDCYYLTNEEEESQGFVHAGNQKEKATGETMQAIQPLIRVEQVNRSLQVATFSLYLTIFKLHSEHELIWIKSGSSENLKEGMHRNTQTEIKFKLMTMLQNDILLYPPRWNLSTTHSLYCTLVNYIQEAIILFSEHKYVKRFVLQL